MATEATENGGATTQPGTDPVQTGQSTVKVDESDTAALDTSVVEATPAAAPAPATTPSSDKKWPGWPGDNVFRLIVPVLKVGSIIGKKGELIKKICEETKARIRILDGVLGTSDRIVLISGKEEPEARLSPAMNAVIRVVKRINGLPENEDEDNGSSTSGGVPCSVRLLVASSQAINLIGKQGSLIKSIQESTTASVRVLSGDEVPFYATSEERVVDIQGESPKVLKALEAVVGHLRKFLVDHSVIPLFEKVGNTTQNNATGPQDHAVETWADKSSSFIHTGTQTGIGNDYSLSMQRDSLFLDRDTHLGSPRQHSGLSLYGQDPALSGLRSSVLARGSAPVITQMTQTMQISLQYAEDIIGIGGANIAYIRRTSGAILTVQESRGLPDEITVELKGTSSQVQTAQQLIQDFITGHRDPVPGSYGNRDPIQGGYSNRNPALGSYGNRDPAPGSYGNRDPAPGGYGNRDPAPGGYGNRDPAPGGYGNRDPVPGGYSNRDPIPGSYGNREPIPGSYSSRDTVSGSYGNRDAVPSSYGKMDTGLRSSYSQLGNTPYSSSSLPSQGLGGYGSSGLGGYGNYRL